VMPAVDGLGEPPSEQSRPRHEANPRRLCPPFVRPQPIGGGDAERGKVVAGGGGLGERTGEQLPPAAPAAHPPAFWEADNGTDGGGGRWL
jgi:hypothetical protein